MHHLHLNTHSYFTLTLLILITPVLEYIDSANMSNSILIIKGYTSLQLLCCKIKHSVSSRNGPPKRKEYPSSLISLIIQDNSHVRTGTNTNQPIIIMLQWILLCCLFIYPWDTTCMDFLISFDSKFLL